MHSVYLKCVFNIAVRCETAIKTCGPLNKHYQLGDGPNFIEGVEFKLTIVLLSTNITPMPKNKLADHGHSFQCSLCIICN